jgi:3-hydroxyisobutyrate dehydrogenase-like beta-hydroxyacid dehydrogenase
LAGLKPGGIHIGLTTISVKTSEKLEKLHKEKGCIYLAGPVMGRPDAAESGKLRTFMSGDQSAIERCEDLVKSYTAGIIKLGDSAREAASMKICGNYVAITQIEMMGEIYTFAEKSGLNLDLIQMVFHGMFTEPTLQMYAAKIKSRDFDDAGFEALGGLKDVMIFEEAFTDVGVIPGIAKVVKDKLVSVVARGMGNKDWSATYEITRLLAGLDD